LQVKEMALGNVLAWMARTAAVHVGFVHEALYISREPVTGAATTRVYDVRDLAMPIRHFPGPELSIPQPGGTGASIGPAPTPDEVGRYDLDGIIELLDHIQKSR
jgi:hypothetical protein